MCRFLIYKGQSDILLSELISEPTHSMLHQSMDCRLRPNIHRRPHNADGFGLGYYPNPLISHEPCLYTTITPAWNSVNLARIANKVTSNLVFVHTRATITGQISQQNCHPFQYGRLMFMHNGGIGGWSLVKRLVSESVADRWFSCVYGNTDSEWCFAVFLDSMDKLGVSPAEDPGPTGFSPVVLRQALLLTIQRINSFTSQLPYDEARQSKFNFAVADGHTVVCTRYCNKKSEEPTSLFFTSGTEWNRVVPETETDAAGNVIKGEYRMHRGDKSSPLVLIASEPLTFFRDNWTPVPASSIITVLRNQSVLIHPIDEDSCQPNTDAIRLQYPLVNDVDNLATAGRDRAESLDSLAEYSSAMASLFTSDSSFMTDESAPPSVSEECV